MSKTALRRDENPIAEWRPGLRVFLRKMLFPGFIAAVLPGAVVLEYGFLFWLVGLPVAMAAYMPIFDDHTEWLRRRGFIWRLTDQRLILFDTHESDDPASFALPGTVLATRDATTEVVHA